MIDQLSTTWRLISETIIAETQFRKIFSFKETCIEGVVVFMSSLHGKIQKIVWEPFCYNVLQEKRYPFGPIDSFDTTILFTKKVCFLSQLC